MKKPCAYCGKSETKRHNGHVISASLYPSSTPSDIQRPTVPECEECQKIWTDEETQFRNIILIAGQPNEAVFETWKTVLRSFEKPSGKKWLSDVFNAMIPVDTPEGPRHKVYPSKIESVNLVLRKIVRGLSAYHGIGSVIPDENVWVGYAPENMPQQVRSGILVHNLGTDFVQYGYLILEEETEIRSAWLIRFYGSRDFLGMISKTGDAKRLFGPKFNP